MTKNCAVSRNLVCAINGSRKKSPLKKAPPDSKPNPVPNLTLNLPLTPHGEAFFRRDFFLTP